MTEIKNKITTVSGIVIVNDNSVKTCKYSFKTTSVGCRLVPAAMITSVQGSDTTMMLKELKMVTEKNSGT